MHRRLTKPDVEESQNKNFYFNLHEQLSYYFWYSKDSKFLLLGYLFYQSFYLLSIIFEKDTIKIWSQDEPYFEELRKAFDYLNFMRRLSELSLKAFYISFFSLVGIIVFLNIFLPLGLLFPKRSIFSFFSKRLVGKIYIWISTIFYFHYSDVLLMPYRYLRQDCSEPNPNTCYEVPNKVAVTLKIVGPIIMFWWLVQNLVILHFTDNSRISRGRYFIRYSFEFEMILLVIISIARVEYNVFNGKYLETKLLLNFVLFVGLFLEVKYGDGIVHPVTIKYMMLFCIIPIWFSLAQIIRVFSGEVAKDSLIIFSIGLLFFLPIYCFKTDSMDLSLLTGTHNDQIASPRKLLIKLDTLLVLLREETHSVKYSMLLEGVIREYQEYGSGDEELLNDFTFEDMLDKKLFFSKRRKHFLRLISLYYMKGISKFPDFKELKFSFVYFVFDFLELQNQAIEFLRDMQGQEMTGTQFFKWIIVKTEIEADILKRDEAVKKEQSKLSKANQKIKYDHLIETLTSNITKLNAFWKLVSEENTKVRAIRDSLNVLTQSLEELEEYWNKEKRFLNTIPKCQFIYGLFLKECINQHAEGEKLIHQAYDELNKQKNSAQNFADIDLSTNLTDVEKGIAFVKIPKREKSAFINNCTKTFGKMLGADPNWVLNTPLMDYIPDELSDYFFQYIQTLKQNTNDDSQAIHSLPMLFPFLMYRTYLVKDFFLQAKVIFTALNEPFLILNLNYDNDQRSSKILVDSSSFNIRYMNGSFFGEYLEGENNNEIQVAPQDIYLNQIFPMSILDPLNGLFEHAKENPPRITNILTLLNDEENTQEIQFEEDGSVYLFKLVVLPNGLACIKILKDEERAIADRAREIEDEIVAMSNVYQTCQQKKKKGRFAFYYDLVTFNWVGQCFEKLSHMTERSETSTAYFSNRFLEMRNSERDFKGWVGGENRQAIDYSLGVLTLKLNKEGRLTEIFFEDHIEEDTEREPLTQIKQKNANSLDERETEGPEANFQKLENVSELKDPETMKKVIERLGKSNFYNVKIILICFKLLINISAGIVFYIISNRLFDVLSRKLALDNNIGVLTIDFLQLGYLSQEKIFLTEGSLKSKLQIPMFLESANNLTAPLIVNCKNRLASMPSLLKELDLAPINDLWYNEQTFKLKKLASDTIFQETSKEGFSQLMSSALVQVNKTQEYYHKNNKNLRLFIHNCFTGLFESNMIIMKKLRENHKVFSDNRRNLLFVLLLIKIGIGVLFVVSTMTLYIKETSRKEEVIGLYYGFMLSDIQETLETNQLILSQILNKDNADLESAVDLGNIEKETKKNKLEKDDPEDEDSLRFMMAKRIKTKGKLDKFCDFNKLYIIFFAAINTGYFVFLYFWNISKYMEYWSLARLSKNNNDMAVSVSYAYDRTIMSIYNQDQITPIDDIGFLVERYHDKRKNLFSELFKTKYSSHSTFSDFLKMFFQDNCHMTTNPRVKLACPTLIQNSVKNVGFSHPGLCHNDDPIYERSQDHG